MEDYLNGRQHKWKTNSRRSQWKMTSIEDELNGREPQWKTTAIEEALNGSLPCLASQFCTELGPAQPQLGFSLLL